MTAVRLALLPRDGLFAKDGRGWFTSASNKGRGLEWPFPTTILGALRTAVGREIERSRAVELDSETWLTHTREVALGAVLALCRPLGGTWGQVHRRWPAPADAVAIEGRPHFDRLDPERPRLPTLGRTDDAARENLWRGYLDSRAKPVPQPRWWTEDMLVGWLSGQAIDVPAPDRVDLGLPGRTDIHLSIDPAVLTAEAGALYSIELRETMVRLRHQASSTIHEWAIGLEATLPAPTGPVVTLAADRRRASVEPLEAALFEPPAALLSAFTTSGTRGLRLLAVTPARFQSGWLPDGFVPTNEHCFEGALPGVSEPVVLRAAMVGRPQHVSGWDMQQGAPKPTLRLVTPGSVYFFTKVSGGPFTRDDARALWLAAWGGHSESGLGRIVPGIWNPPPAAAGA